MTISHSRILVVEGGVIVNLGDGIAHRIEMTLEDRISLASQLLSRGVVEMRNKAATDSRAKLRPIEALMSGIAAGDVYVEEEEKDGN